MSDWYSDHELYHKIGYLVLARSVGGYQGIDLEKLVKEALCSTKDDFKSGINKRIQQSIDWNFKDLRYEGDSNKIFNILLLFNVETNYQSEYEPYPFKFHKSKNWSLEHIHARNSDKFDKNNKDQWKTWLEYHLPILEKKEQTPEIQQLIDQVKRYLGNPDRLSWENFIMCLIKCTNILIKMTMAWIIWIALAILLYWV